MSKFVVFAGKEKNAGGIYDIYKMAETREEAVNYLKEALFVEKNTWSHIVSLDDLAVIMDSTKFNVETLIEEKKPAIKAPFQLPKLELSKSENWIEHSCFKFRKSRDSKYVGFDIESNIVIPDNILVVGGYPDSKEDFEKMREMGIDTFVCLNVEYGKMDRNKNYSPYAETEIYGSAFIHVPIVDMGTTDDKTILDLCLDLKKRILGGSKLYVHCSGGHGRTGTVVCVLLHMLYPELTDNQIFDYVQFTHDQRIGYYGPGYFTSKLLDHNLGMYFQNGQVPTPQTCTQRNQVKQLIAENRAYIEVKKNYDGDIHLQQQIGFEEWFELMKNYDIEEEKNQNDFVTVFGGGFKK
jgi:hypothetical protein